MPPITNRDKYKADIQNRLDLSEKKLEFEIARARALQADPSYVPTQNDFDRIN